MFSASHVPCHAQSGTIICQADNRGSRVNSGWIRFVKTFSLALSDTWLAVKDIFVRPQRKA